MGLCVWNWSSHAVNEMKQAGRAREVAKALAKAEARKRQEKAIQRKQQQKGKGKGKQKGEKKPKDLPAPERVVLPGDKNPTKVRMTTPRHFMSEWATCDHKDLSCFSPVICLLYTHISTHNTGPLPPRAPLRRAQRLLAAAQSQGLSGLRSLGRLTAAGGV